MSNDNIILFPKTNVLFFGSVAPTVNKIELDIYFNELCNENPLILPILKNDVSSFKKIYMPELANKTPKGQYPLYMAMFYADKEIRDILIRDTHDLNRKDATGSTLLHHVFRGIEITARLAREIQKTSDDSDPRFHTFVSHTRLMDTAKKLILKGVDVNVVNKFGETPLSFAVHSCQFDAVKLLIESGANACRGISCKRATPHLSERLNYVTDPFMTLGGMLFKKSRQYRKESLDLLKKSKTPYEWGQFYNDPEIISLLEKGKPSNVIYNDSALDKLNKFKKTLIKLVITYITLMTASTLANRILEHDEHKVEPKPSVIWKNTSKISENIYQKER